MIMEREIKFRGKRIDNGEWVYGYVIYNQWHNTYKIDTGLYGIPSATVDPETIGQYTGLKDRDGKEIYEGDLLRRINHYVGEKPYYTVHEVAWTTKYCAWYCFHTKNERSELITGNCFLYAYLSGSEYEVIGNIYEHPELLKQQQ